MVWYFKMGQYHGMVFDYDTMVWYSIVWDLKGGGRGGIEGISTSRKVVKWYFRVISGSLN